MENYRLQPQLAYTFYLSPYTRMPSNRWSRLDSDEERLPAGMKRVGYDADDGRYTFQDQEGLWLGEPGAEFGGRLTYAGPGEHSLSLQVKLDSKEQRKEVGRS